MKNKLKILTIVDLAMRRSKAELSYFEIGIALGLGTHLTEEIIEEIEEIMILTINQKLIEVYID